jgi:hypothetical protein
MTYSQAVSSPESVAMPYLMAQYLITPRKRLGVEGRLPLRASRIFEKPFLVRKGELLATPM